MRPKSITRTFFVFYHIGVGTSRSLHLLAVLYVNGPRLCQRRQFIYRHTVHLDYLLLVESTQITVDIRYIKSYFL